ncbi:MAG TPA: hypothetical protein VMP03_05050, partial [Methylomirabilota bacterium]|nr:hypothetical protein [Methylomirabilota bacterium]
MTRLRLLPIVLFAVTALLCLKLLGLASGLGSFAVGPAPASAQAGAPPMPDFLGAPLDLAAEAEALRRQEAAAAAAAAGDAPPPPSPPEAVDPAQSDIVMDPDSAVPMDAPVAEAPVAEAPAPSEPAPAAAAPADPNAPVLTTERPQEFSPPARTSERKVLESLAVRRRVLDAREADLALRTKLLEAAEAKVQARIDELKAIEAQLGEAASTTEGAEQESLKGLVT